MTTSVGYLTFSVSCATMSVSFATISVSWSMHFIGCTMIYVCMLDDLCYWDMGSLFPHSLQHYCCRFTRCLLALCLVAFHAHACAYAVVWCVICCHMSVCSFGLVTVVSCGAVVVQCLCSAVFQLDLAICSHFRI
jgi:hypothetical protein